MTSDRSSTVGTGSMSRVLRHAAVGICAIASPGVGAIPDERLVRVPAPVVDAEEVAQRLSGDVRVVVLGDSFSTVAFNKVFAAWLLVQDRPIAAVAGSATDRNKIVRGIPQATPSIAVQSSAATQYEFLNSTPEREFFGLPVRGITEFYGTQGGATGSNGELIRLMFEGREMTTGQTGSPVRVGDELRFRFLYYIPKTPTAPVVAEVSLRHATFGVRNINPLTDARPTAGTGQPLSEPSQGVAGHINAYYEDLPVVANGDFATISVRQTLDFFGSQSYFHPAGSLFYKVDTDGHRFPGLYYAALADESWSYFGFGSDRSSLNAFDKAFSVDELARWLDVTSLDVTQPTVFIYYLAFEPDPDGRLAVQIEAMVDQANAAASAAGLTDVFHCLVVPHSHYIYLPGPILRPDMAERQRDAMFEIARRRADVAALSLYDITNGVFFRNTANARAFLAATAPAPFVYGANVVAKVGGTNGTLLDIYGVHPLDQDSAAYFAHLVEQLIAIPGRPTDLNVDGTIDIDDLYAWYASPADLDQDGDADAEDAAGLERYIRRDEAKDMQGTQR